MKNTLGFALVLTSLISSASVSFAQSPDVSCGAKLYESGGKVRKVRVERQARTYIGKNLILGFAGNYFAGEPTTMVFVIEDARSGKREILTSTIKVSPPWQWNIERDTVYGHLSVNCY